MDIMHLHYFRMIVSCGSMNKAAQRLFVSQPSLSSAMTRLETEIGFPLFFRKKGVLSLTKEGEQFLACVERVLDDLEGTLKTLRLKRIDRENYISVATGISDLISAVLYAHFNDLSDFRINQISCKNDQVANLVENQLADWGIIYGSSHALQLNCELLHECSRVFVMRVDHPLLRYDRMPASALPEQKYICNHSRDERDVLRFLGKNYHFLPEIESECDDEELELYLLNTTDCISTMPALAALRLNRMRPDKPLRYLMPDFELPRCRSYVVYQNFQEISKYSQKLIKYIKRFLKEEEIKLDIYLKTGRIVPR